MSVPLLECLHKEKCIAVTWDTQSLRSSAGTWSPFLPGHIWGSIPRRSQQPSSASFGFHLSLYFWMILFSLLMHNSLWALLSLEYHRFHSTDFWLSSFLPRCHLLVLFFASHVLLLSGYTFESILFFLIDGGTSLVVQWLRLPMQEAWVRFLVRELDPACCN